MRGKKRCTEVPQNVNGAGDGSYSLYSRCHHVPNSLACYTKT